MVLLIEIGQMLRQILSSVYTNQKSQTRVTTVCQAMQGYYRVSPPKNVWKSDKSWEPEKIWKFENLKIEMA